MIVCFHMYYLLRRNNLTLYSTSFHSMEQMKRKLLFVSSRLLFRRFSTTLPSSFFFLTFRATLSLLFHLLRRKSYLDGVKWRNARLHIRPLRTFRYAKVTVHHRNFTLSLSAWWKTRLRNRSEEKSAIPFFCERARSILTLKLALVSSYLSSGANDSFEYLMNYI